MNRPKTIWFLCKDEWEGYESYDKGVVGLFYEVENALTAMAKVVDDEMTNPHDEYEHHEKYNNDGPGHSFTNHEGNFHLGTGCHIYIEKHEMNDA